MEKYVIELRARRIGRQVAWKKMKIYCKHIYQAGAQQGIEMAQVVQQKIASWRDSLQGSGANERSQGTQGLQWRAALGWERSGGPGRAGVRQKASLWQEV